MDSMCIDLMQGTGLPTRDTMWREHIDHIQSIIKGEKAFCDESKQNQDIHC